MNKISLLVIKWLVFSYANMTVTQAEKSHRKSVWWKQAKEASKYFHKRELIKVYGDERKIYDELAKKLAVFDAEYFADKHFSAYLCFIGLLQYLVLEIEDEEMVKKFGHYPFGLINRDIYNMKEINDVNKYIDRYVTKVIEILEEFENEKTNS